MHKGDAMLRSVLVILLIALLTGCSELKVISSAALRELRADGMNVEQITYNYNKKLAAREKAGIIMAKVDSRRFAADGSVVAEEKKVKIAKVKKVKGLWEKASL